MHAAFYRPNEVNLQSISVFLLEDITEFVRNCFTTLNEMHNVLTFNKIWKQRLVGIGTYSYKTCLDYGLTGVMARSVGLRRDIRLSKLETYANYYHLNFRSYIGQRGDCYDRFLIRMNEMVESLFIITQVINNLTFIGKTKKVNQPAKSVYTDINAHHLLNYIYPQLANNSKNKNQYNSMDNLIDHFKYWNEGITVKSNITYQSIEAPKGEFGVTLVANDTSKPYKCKVRPSCYSHLQVLPVISKGHFLADLAALIGTVDIVFGEIDR